MVASGLVVQIVVVVASVLGLWVGARALVDAVVALARRFGVSELVIGLTIVAIGTSTPELVVTTDAALAGLGDIAVGNVVGSNVYNLAFILGTVSLVRVVPVERSLVHRDGLVLLGATLAGFAALGDLTVTRLEGGLLLGAAAAYTLFLLWDERSATSIATEYPATEIPASPAERASFGVRETVVLLGGLVVVLLSGHFLVEAASTLARQAGVSDWVIGGTIVAAGTSTPEFAVSLVAMREGHVGMSVGNVVGSNVFNVLAIMGLAALVRPLTVGDAALETTLWLTVVTVAAVAALWSGRKLSRLEGGLFVLSEVLRWILGLFRIFG